MNATLCGKCEAECPVDNRAVSQPYRKSWARCEACDTVFCVDCLRKMAIEQGGMSENELCARDESERDDAFLFHCEATGMNMCAECFEKDE